MCSRERGIFCKGHTRRLGEIGFSAVCALALALAGCGLLWWGVSAPSTREAVPVGLSQQSAPPSPKYETRAIRDIRTGHRVMADNPELADEDVPAEEVIPETRRNVVFRQVDPDGNQVEFELLRSLDWIERTGATVGGTVELDLAEFGIEGPAKVLDVRSCPQLEDGLGRLVTGTFRRTSQNVIDVHIEGLDDPIGTTANHPFWSEDRQAFVAAGELRAGEAVLRANGLPGRVKQVNTTPRVEVVHNLEVDGEHVYYVSSAGVLVHNMCAKSIALGRDIVGGGYKALAQQIGASRWQFWARNGITRRTVSNRFGRAFHQAVERADEIHFSLDGIDDVAGALRAGKRGFVRDNMTNAELRYLFDNPELLKKTIFYRMGRDGLQHMVPFSF